MFYFLYELKQRSQWRHLTVSGSLRNDDGDENVSYWKVNLRCLKLNRAYSISFISSNVGKFFWNWILKDCIKVQEKKKKVVVLCSRPRRNMKLLRAASRCSRATTAEKCTKKRDARAKLLFCLSKPIAFLPFPLPAPSSLHKRDLKIQDGSEDDGVRLSKLRKTFRHRNLSCRFSTEQLHLLVPIFLY